MLVRGNEIPPPVDNSIRLFLMCQAFEFKHLPMPGGIYDQHPDILERFMYILQEQQKEEEKKRKQKQRGESGPRRIRNASSRRP